MAELVLFTNVEAAKNNNNLIWNLLAAAVNSMFSLCVVIIGSDASS